MKKYFYILAALSIVPNLSLAQAGNFDAEVDQELDQMYANKQGGAAAVAPAPTTGAVGGTAAQGSQPIYILNQATPTSNANAQTQTQQVQKQPVAVIESTPLVESKAEMMRKSRQDAEIHTEQKIVEKLEASRLEDERRRAEALFGNRLESQPQAPVAPAPAPVIVQQAPTENMRNMVREELQSAMKVDQENTIPVESRYFSAIVGIGDYPDARNVQGNYALGAALGTKFDFLILEGSFIYSDYTLEQINCCNNVYYPKLVNVAQYQGAMATKYQLMSGMVRPVVGGLVAYSYRKYDWANTYGPYYNNNNTGTTASSHAIDLGVTAGVDLEFSKKFAVGFEYKYMFNLSSRIDNQSIMQMAGPQYYGTPLEKLSYYVLALSAKVNF